MQQSKGRMTVFALSMLAATSGFSPSAWEDEQLPSKVTTPNGQIWSLYQPRSQIPQAITIWSRLPRESSVPPLVCGADLNQGNQVVNCFSFACPGGEKSTGEIRGVRVATCHCPIGESFDGKAVEPRTASGHRRVRGILRSASITRLADRSHPLREGTRSRTSNTAGTGATIAAATVLMGIKG